MKNHIYGTLCVNLLVALSNPAEVLASGPDSGRGTWETTLQGRDLDGDLSTIEAYYDTVLDITWLADSHYAMTSGADDNGHMDWYTATAWAAGLDPYGSGITGWRLPTGGRQDTAVIRPSFRTYLVLSAVSTVIPISTS